MLLPDIASFYIDNEAGEWDGGYNVGLSELGKDDPLVRSFAFLYDYALKVSDRTRNKLNATLAYLEQLQDSLVLPAHPADAPDEADVGPDEERLETCDQLAAIEEAERAEEIRGPAADVLDDLSAESAVAAVDEFATAARKRVEETARSNPQTEVTFEESAMAHADELVAGAKKQAAAGEEPGRGTEAVDTVPGLPPLEPPQQSPEQPPEQPPGPSLGPTGLDNFKKGLGMLTGSPPPTGSPPSTPRRKKVRRKKKVRSKPRADA